MKSLAVGVAILCSYTRKINYDPATIILIDIPLKKIVIGNLIMGKLHREECRDTLNIHNQRSGKFVCGLAKRRKSSNWSGCADKTCFPTFQKPNPKNLRASFEDEWWICKLSLEWRRLKKSKHYPFELENTVKTGVLVWSPFSKENFWKFTLCFKNLRAANERWTLSRKESVLILKIGWVEPLSFSLWKLLVGVVFENGASRASELLS